VFFMFPDALALGRGPLVAAEILARRPPAVRLVFGRVAADFRARRQNVIGPGVDDRRQPAKAGFDHHPIKPVKISELRQVLDLPLTLLSTQPAATANDEQIMRGCWHSTAEAGKHRRRR
jgi:hypothetical protein